MLQYYALPEVQRYLEWKARDKAEAVGGFESMRKQTRLTRPGDTLTLAAIRKGDGKLLGHVSLVWTDATAAQGEIRFAFNPQFRQQGLRQRSGEGRHFARLRHVQAAPDRRADCRQERAAARLLNALGMRLEAHYREHALFQGEWDEELHFAVLDREWQRGAKVHEITRHKVA